MRYSDLETKPLTELWDQGGKFKWVSKTADQWSAHIPHGGKIFTLAIENDEGMAYVSMGKVNRFWMWLDRILVGGGGVPTDDGVGAGSTADALKIFGSVIAAVEDFMREAKPNVIIFSGLTQSHNKLYATLMRKMKTSITALGYSTGFRRQMFALIRNQITEAPISDIHLFGPNGAGDWDEGTGFDKVDQDLLASEKGRAKMFRAFERTPHVFEVYFMNSGELDGNGEDNEFVDNHVGRYGAGVRDSYKNIEGKAGVIRVVMISNLSPRADKAPGAIMKMPITAWTLAHKIGHGFQDEVITGGGWKSPIGSKVEGINKCLRALHDPLHYTRSGEPRGFNFPSAMRHMLTMKSARDNKLDNEFEFFAEVVAQYLITGKVTVNLEKSKYNVSAEVQTEIDAVRTKATKMLHGYLEALFKSCEGKVILEL